ncbi:hypothetical protein [Halegenticoccus tardaugens]|uniref:hypothetical protein n=1 Tax=Halegenticoccus tardaugens TaxID=2071624 RepID=UPI0013E91544|nr:hypothetical protein [Halegenticoccus tardaugens]
MDGNVARFRQFKRLIGIDGGERPPYVCLGCGSRFEVQYHVCPDCGGYRVEHATDG